MNIYNPLNMVLVLNGKEVDILEAVTMCDKGDGIFKKWEGKNQHGPCPLFVSLNRYAALKGVKTQSLQFRSASGSVILSVEFPK